MPGFYGANWGRNSRRSVRGGPQVRLRDRFSLGGVLFTSLFLLAAVLVGLAAARWGVLTLAAMAALGLLAWLVTRPADQIVGYVLLLHVAAFVLVPFLALGPTLLAAAVGGLLLFDFAALGKARRAIHAPAGLIPLTALLVMTLAVTGLSRGFDNTSSGALILPLLMFPSFLLAGNLTATERRIAMRGLVILALIQVGIAALESSEIIEAPWSRFVDFGPDNALIPDLPRARGTMLHALPLAMLLLVALALLFQPEVSWSRRVRIPLGAACVLGCVLAGSRSGVLMCVVLVVFFAGSTARRWRRPAGALAFVVLAAALEGAGFFRSGPVRTLLESGSTYQRAELIDVVPRLLGQPWAAATFGNGWGAAKELFARGYLQRTGFEAVDNQFVTTFTVVGLIGLALLVAIFLLVWANASRSMRAGLVVLVASFNVFDVLAWHSTTLITAVVLGLAASRAPVASSTEPAVAAGAASTRSA